MNRSATEKDHQVLHTNQVISSVNKIKNSEEKVFNK